MGILRDAPVHRRNTTIVATIFYLITIPFLILVSIGNTHINSTLNDIYFFKLDVSQIIPISVAPPTRARPRMMRETRRPTLEPAVPREREVSVTFCARSARMAASFDVASSVPETVWPLLVRPVQ